jgi:hypothetical protein
VIPGWFLALHATTKFWRGPQRITNSQQLVRWPLCRDIVCCGRRQAKWSRSFVANTLMHRPAQDLARDSIHKKPENGSHVVEYCLMIFRVDFMAVSNMDIFCGGRRHAQGHVQAGPSTRTTDFSYSSFAHIPPPSFAQQAQIKRTSREPTCCFQALLPWRHLLMRVCQPSLACTIVFVTWYGIALLLDLLLQLTPTPNVPHIHIWSKKSHVFTRFPSCQAAILPCEDASRVWHGPSCSTHGTASLCCWTRCSSRTNAKCTDYQK